MNVLNLAALDIDLAESIVTLDKEQPMMLIQFLEVNSDFSPLDVLTIITSLVAKGFARIDGGNGGFSLLTLTKISFVRDRGIALPYLSA